MNIELTERAAQHVRKYLAGSGANGIRVKIKSTGCSGYAYEVEALEALTDDDKVFESQGVTVAVDAKSYPLVAGTILDYTREGLNEGFQFKNPNVKETCGCGESFTV